MTHRNSKTRDSIPGDGRRVRFFLGSSFLAFCLSLRLLHHLLISAVIQVILIVAVCFLVILFLFVIFLFSWFTPFFIPFLILVCARLVGGGWREEGEI